MASTYPEIDISNQLGVRCCVRVAQYEPHIASEKNIGDDQNSWGIPFLTNQWNDRGILKTAQLGLAAWPVRRASGGEPLLGATLALRGTDDDDSARRLLFAPKKRNKYRGK